MQHIDDEDYFIDWTEKIKRFVDSVSYPYDNAKAIISNKIVQIIEVDIHEEHRQRHIGKVLFYKDGFPVIICSDALLINNKDITLNFRTRFN